MTDSDPNGDLTRLADYVRNANHDGTTTDERARNVLGWMQVLLTSLSDPWIDVSNTTHATIREVYWLLDSTLGQPAAAAANAKPPRSNVQKSKARHRRFGLRGLDL